MESSAAPTARTECREYHAVRSQDLPIWRIDACEHRAFRMLIFFRTGKRTGGMVIKPNRLDHQKMTI
jgi:hypothetical protein